VSREFPLHQKPEAGILIGNLLESDILKEVSSEVVTAGKIVETCDSVNREIRFSSYSGS
jgi:hypothetical protein